MKAIWEKCLKKGPRNIQLGILALGLMGAFLISSGTTEVSAQGNANNFGWYHGMVTLAEQEIRTNVEKVVMENKVKTVSNITATTNYDTECVHNHERKESDKL